MEQTKKPMIILTGPTAVGKTDLSIQLAKQIGGAVISADSMQVYRYMDIGSAKITPEEMHGVRHYLIDDLLPTEEFNIVKFQEMAKIALRDIYADGLIPIVTGGTGFYIQALLYDINFTVENGDPAYRRSLEQFAEINGNHALHEKLKEIDPVSYESIHENNVKRVIRALEFYHLSGVPISSHNEEERKRSSPYNFAYFVLTDDRAHLYDRIDKRVNLMIQAGLVEEVTRLKEMGCKKEMVSMQGLGYKEIFDYLEGKTTLDEAIYIIKRETRHFAKRQLTWFRRERDVVWFDKSKYHYDDRLLLNDMLQYLQNKGVTNESVFREPVH